VKGRRRDGRNPRSVLIAIAMVLMALLSVELIVAAWMTGGAPSRSAAPPAAAASLDEPLGRLPLIDEHGRRTSLAAFRGRYVVLAPSLTLCHEVCPLTTAALTELRSELARNGLGRRVAVVQATVDPWRDSPARLRAFRHLTGSPIQFLTGTQAEIRNLWRRLGVAYERVPQGHPADLDWWTGKRETFDVQHTDGAFVIDPRGHLRAAFVGMPAVDTRLPQRLSRLLNDTGRANLRHPEAPWTAREVLAAVTNLAGTGRRPAGANQVLDSGLAQRLRSLRGHPVVLNEWASWCPPCRIEMPFLAAAASRYAGRVDFVGLNVRDQAPAARRFLAQHPLGYPSFADPDGTAAARLGPSVGLPTTVFLDASGKVVSVHMGQYSSAAALVRDIQQHAL
jgi:cytochrome oxidase Cu insertion factor (SCO1/SenC/PrrC family)/thiol-disulfide isomerase/thioredoxin